MYEDNKRNKSKSSFYRVIAATLTIGGVSLLSPMMTMALGTTARQAINNTATGTYEDPNNPGLINTTSNTVTATVAEVAGLTNVPAGLTDLNLGSVTTNDAVNFAFLITNTGNDVTAIHIPSTLVPTGGKLGTDGSNAVAADQLFAGIYVTEINGIVLAKPVLVTGTDTNDTTFKTAINDPTKGNYTSLAGAPFTGTINVNATVKVIVPVTVTATNAGSPVAVQFGDTGNNDNTAGTQNQPDSGVEPPAAAGSDPQGATKEVYTVNFVGAGTGVQTPVNGEREASAFQTVNMATQVNNLALATVLKTLTVATPGASTAILSDDTITYRLDLRVESNSPAAGITPAPLLGTAINLDSTGSGTGTATSQIKILVSDAIPALTTLDTNFIPTVPTGWTRVYTTDAPSTTGPLAATWRTGTLPTTGVKRIGFIADGPLAAGTTTVTDPNGFQIRVITTGVPLTGGTIANIAQVLGQTTAGVISATNPLVYDESGDQNPNNFDGATPPAAITTVGTSPSGVANIANDDTDPNNDNKGAGPGGEDNVYSVNPPGSILNGPPGNAGALGPNNTSQTDFVNKSAVVPAGQTADYNPDPVTFTNTVENPSSNAGKLDNVILEPISATLAAKAVFNTGSPSSAQITLFDLTTDTATATPDHAVLPNGTTVLIAYGTRSALYTYNGTDFSLTSSFATNNGTGTADATAAPISIPSLAVNTALNYTVKVDLPTSAVTTGYSVPIVAYVNSNPGGTFKSVSFSEDSTFNIKIDRVYTGYLKLVKESLIMRGTGLPVKSGDETRSQLAKSPTPGNIIQYFVKYTNISTTGVGGTTNVLLKANNIVITEDGVTATGNTNNWAGFTLNVPSTTTDPTSGAAITYFNGAASAVTTDTVITKYVDTIPTLAPGLSVTLTFQRQVK